MKEKLSRLILDDDIELRERLFRVTILAGEAAALLGIAECFFVMDINNYLIPAFAFLILVMGCIWAVTFKYRNYDLAAVMLGVVIIALLFPVMFFLSGGVESGAPVWLALGILYIFIMFSGKRLLVFLFLCSIVYLGTYGVAYYYPELIFPMKNDNAVYVDSIFSIFAVGLISGIISKNHAKMYEREHELNLQQKEELERNNKAKSMFFTNVSHEIRTPINTIIGLNEMILRSNPTGETREYVQDIQLASKLLLNQVNDILDLSQLEMQKMSINPINYQTLEMFRDLVEMVRVRVEKKKLKLIVHVDPELPSVLQGDERRIKQIMLNLLDNAVKYTEEGSVSLLVQGERSSRDEWTLQVNVEDTGIGIRNEEMTHIYEYFNRADEEKNLHITGSGVGLSIVKQLVDLMDGEIKVDSIYTKGTTFTVILKQKIVEDTPVGDVDLLFRELTATEVYRAAFEAPAARILIVDDNDMNLSVISKLLSATKVQIDIASSGEECLRMTKAKYYNVILMDYMMPKMDGVQTTKQLRIQENGLCRDTAVIVLTGNALVGQRQFYLEQGFDGYVEKPIQGKLLEKEILQFLPENIVERQNVEPVVSSKMGQMYQPTRHKRKKVMITTDCVSDIPDDLLDKYDIQTIYKYIKTPKGRFLDTLEIDCDSLNLYVQGKECSAHAEFMTVSEYEDFFAEALTKAEHVLHIAAADFADEGYQTAVDASKCFGHVKVINSGQISCGQGLLTLYAAKLAMEGKQVKEICDAIEKLKLNVRTILIMPSSGIFYQKGFIRSMMAKICNEFQLHPLVCVNTKKMTVRRLVIGNSEYAWKQAIRWYLRKGRANEDFIYIVHAGCSVRQQKWLIQEVNKYVPFEKVILQKACFSNACNWGTKAIGISYLAE